VTAERAVPAALREALAERLALEVSLGQVDQAGPEAVEVSVALAESAVPSCVRRLSIAMTATSARAIRAIQAIKLARTAQSKTAPSAMWKAPLELVRRETAWPIPSGAPPKRLAQKQHP